MQDDLEVYRLRVHLLIASHVAFGWCFAVVTPTIVLGFTSFVDTQAWPELVYVGAVAITVAGCIFGVRPLWRRLFGIPKDVLAWLHESNPRAELGSPRALYGFLPYDVDHIVIRRPGLGFLVYWGIPFAIILGSIVYRPATGIDREVVISSLLSTFLYAGLVSHFRRKDRPGITRVTDVH